eukprot:jgi/Tetstr1/455555/TSEL_042377.t1
MRWVHFPLADLRCNFVGALPDDSRDAAHHARRPGVSATSRLSASHAPPLACPPETPGSHKRQASQGPRRTSGKAAAVAFSPAAVMSDMEELPLHAVAEAEQPEQAGIASSGHSPASMASSFHQADSGWDPIWAHAHMHPAHQLASLHSAATSEGGSSEQLLAEWEVLTEPGTPVSGHSSPVRCATPPQPEGVLRPAALQMQEMPGGAAWPAHSPLAPATSPPAAPTEIAAAPLSEGAALGGDPLSPAAAAVDDGGASLLGSTGSGSFFSGSLDSADHLDSPYSADLVMASVDAFRAQRASKPASPKAPPPAAPADPADVFVHGALGERVTALWAWLEALGASVGRWTSAQLAALHGYVAQLRTQPFLAQFSTESLWPFAASKAGGRGANPLTRTVLVQGAVYVALAAALAMCMADNRRLAGRLRQKDAELAALIMKVFSLQDTLKGARHLPVMCHAMAPIKHPLTGYL